MEKINVAELLKYCPKGMELDCLTWVNVSFEEVKNDRIIIRRNNKMPVFDNLVVLNKYGRVTDYEDEKCRIFPKGKTTWEGFVPPCEFKDGDICYIKTEVFEHIFIFKVNEDYNLIQKYINLSEKHFYTDERPVCSIDDVKEIRLATEEEKQELLQAIKDNGYRWDAKTKTLEKLPELKEGDIVNIIFGDYNVIDILKKLHKEFCYFYVCLNKGGELQIPILNDNKVVYCTSYAKEITFATGEQKNKLFKEIKDSGYWWDTETKALKKLVKPCFKVWDKIRHKNDKTIIKTINYIYHDRYGLCDGHILPFNEQDQYELAPKKFDITTLKTFDKVLVRCSDNGSWNPQFFSRYRPKSKFPFECTYNSWSQCIPYEGNEYLSNTTNDCNDFFKIWE